MKVKKKLLVADDEESLHLYYRELFEGEFEVIEAYDGVDALMKAVEIVPDVMILDIAMPLLDGRTLCAKLKKYALTKDIKIVMVTGKSDQNDRRIGFEVGADDYIEKPTCTQYLIRSVSRLAART